MTARFPPNPQIERGFAQLFPSSPLQKPAWGPGAGENGGLGQFPLDNCGPGAPCWPVGGLGPGRDQAQRPISARDGGRKARLTRFDGLQWMWGTGAKTPLKPPWNRRPLKASEQVRSSPQGLGPQAVNLGKAKPSASALRCPGNCWPRWQASLPSIPTGINIAFSRPRWPVFWCKTAWAAARSPAVISPTCSLPSSEQLLICGSERAGGDR